MRPFLAIPVNAKTTRQRFRNRNYLFDWLATQISRFLHPRPKILPFDYFDTG